MTKQIVAIAIIIMVSFMGSITAILFFTGANFPERTASVPLEDDFDTSFWNLTDTYIVPIDVNNHSSKSSTIEYQNMTVSVNEWYFDYFSEEFRGIDVRINSVILTRQDLMTPAPAILYLHGYGEQYADFIQILREFAAAGYVVMGIDQPGSGNSTGFPTLSPFTFLNVSNGPEDSSLYHSVWAASRAITVLQSLSQVRDDAVIVAGDSMGGLVTFLVSAIDSRIDGSIPMMAAGNFLNTITSGSLLNSVIVPSYYLGSTEMNNLIKWFDPIAYASLLTRPVLYMFGTEDQFFPITSMMDTIQAINADLTLNIVPNWGHAFHLQWSRDIISWIANHFEVGTSLPLASVSFESQVTIQGSGIKIDVEAINTEKVFLCWRSSEPGAVWFVTELYESSETHSGIYTGMIVPLVIGKVSFFIISEQIDSTQISTEVLVGNAGSVFFPFVLVVSSLGIVSLLYFNIWEPKKFHFIREIPYIIGIVTLSAGFLLPFITIEGRAGLSVFGFIELYGESFLLGGWFLPIVLTGICFVIALSAFRHRFQFRAAIMVWFPILLVVIGLYLIFSGVFSYFGDILTIRTGIGAVALIGAIPLMLILDKYRKLRFIEF